MIKFYGKQFQKIKMKKMNAKSWKDTPPLSSRIQKNIPIPILSIGRIQNYANRRDDHLLSISPWYNEDTNLNGRSTNNSGRGAGNKGSIQSGIQNQWSNTLSKQFVRTQKGQNKNRCKTMEARPCMTGRCYTQNIYVDQSKYPTEHNQMENEEEGKLHFQDTCGSGKRIALKMKTLQMVENVHFYEHNTQPSFLPSGNLQKYQSEELNERKMSLNKFRSPTPLAIVEKKNSARKRSCKKFHNEVENKTLQLKSAMKKEKLASDKSVFHKKIASSTVQTRSGNETNFQSDVRNLLHKKLTTDPSVFYSYQKNFMDSLPQQKPKAKDSTNEKMRKLVAEENTSLMFFFQPRQKNNIMGRQRNIMKLRNLMNSSRTSKGKRMRTDGIQHI